MTAGFSVVCSDGQVRHRSLFATRRDASTWQEWHTAHHACRTGHTIRREAEWRVAEFRLVAGADSVTPLPAPAPATSPLSVVESVFGEEPAHA